MFTNTRILTDSGIYYLDELTNSKLLDLGGNYFNGSVSVETNKPSCIVTLGNGRELTCTLDQKWYIIGKTGVTECLTSQLVKGNKLPVIFRPKLSFGLEGDFDDGYNDGIKSILLEQDYAPKMIWSEASNEYRYGFLSAFFDSDHCSVIKSYGKAYELSISSIPNSLLLDFADLLGAYGIKYRVRIREHGVFIQYKNYLELSVYPPGALNLTKIIKLKNKKKILKLEEICELHAHMMDDGKILKVSSIVPKGDAEKVYKVTTTSPSQTIILTTCVSGV